MAQVEANGITQYYDVQGDGPPLLLVAGMGGTANYWAEQVAFFLGPTPLFLTTSVEPAAPAMNP